MAPDLNSVPPSPHPTAPPSTGAHPNTTSSAQASRRPSHSIAMSAHAPAPLSPGLSSHVLPSNQSAVSGQVSNATSVGGGAAEIGPGPLRHPRPLTAADLHLQLEKEQEAVVNRLTRELSLLRAAQNASVVSNTSSTSGTGLPDPQDHNANHMLSGPSHPAPSQRRHHRSSSGASSRSVAAAGLVNMVPSTTADRNRAGGIATGGLSMSRQNSSSNRRSGASSPAPSGSYHMESFPLLYQTQNRPTVPHREVSSGNLSTSGGGVNTGVELTGRYEEVAWQRMELESVKRENEGLKRRIRELERMVRQGRAPASGDSVADGRGRSESVSTTATDAAVRGRERAESSVLEEGGVSVHAGGEAR